jgi:2-C-methyl-D-erythritol 4-phosphate cytidylyltransferase
VDEILLVAHADEMERARAVTADCAKVTNVVAGGATRSQSETRALAALRLRIATGEIGMVMIHDGARPLVTPDEITRLARAVHELAQPGGALLAAPVDAGEETGEIGSDGALARVFAPEELARAQTPQAFHAALLLEAYDRAQADGFEGTDTASTVERFGAPVMVVSGSDENLKLTAPDDLPRAAAIIQARSHP